MAVNVKMGVDLNAFKTGISQGQTILKGLNAQMKSAEAEFKATGNAEKYMADKSKTLNSQLNVQKGVIDQTKKALKAMDAEGIDPSDKAYQQLYATLMNAQAGMYETEAAIKNLGAASQETATEASNLTSSVNSIGKKISLDQVINGIGKITSGLEAAGQKALHLATQLFDAAMESARWAADIEDQADKYGYDLETYQQMLKLVQNGLATTVEAMVTAQKKFNRNVGKGTDDFKNQLLELGLAYEMVGKQGEKSFNLVTDDSLDLFFRAGQAVMNLSDAFDKENIAQTLFGRSWNELVPLFKKYKTVEEYNAALKDTQTNSEGAVKNLHEFADVAGEVEGNIQTISNEILGALAPSLTTLARSLNGVLIEINKYLQTPEGQEMLKQLGDTMDSLFKDLGEIDPASVVESFVKVFDDLVGGLKWLVHNKQLVIDALKGIVIGWGALELTGGALTILQLINNLKWLRQNPANPPVTTGGDGGVSTGGGGWLTGVSNTLAGVLPGIASWISYNGGPVWDWFTHEGPLGTLFSGLQTPQEWIAEKWGNINKNAETFGSDWANLLRNIFGLWDKPADQEYLDFEEELRQRIDEDLNKEPFDFVAEPQIDEQASSQIAEQIGTVHVPISFYIPGGLGGSKFGWSTGGNGTFYYEQGYANGLPDVPNDGLYMLHKGEQVVPAREVSSNNFSSNLYVENMNMNGGLSADALASAIASRNRRIMSGYGS